MGPFESFYAGPVQHPILLWLAAGGALLYCVRLPGLRRGMRTYCIALGLLSLGDAWLTSNVIPGIGALPASLSSAVPLFFVLAGDLRYLLLVTSATPDGDLEITAPRLVRALALTAIVPVLSQVLMGILPESMTTTRGLYLAYELLFVVLAASLLRFALHSDTSSWLGRLSLFVIGYYSLWAGADLIILTTGSDLGFLLRCVPNVLYYGGLIAVIGREASRASNAGARSARDDAAL